MKYLKSMTLSTTALLLFTACGGVRHVPESKGGFYYSGIYFGKNFSQTLKEGVEDGCDTSKGHYTKNHTLFNNDRDLVCVPVPIAPMVELERCHFDEGMRQHVGAHPTPWV